MQNGIDPIAIFMGLIAKAAVVCAAIMVVAYFWDKKEREKEKGDKK